MNTPHMSPTNIATTGESTPNRRTRQRPKAWDSATVASAAISLTLVTVIGLTACGPQNGGPASTAATSTAANDAPKALPQAPVQAPVSRAPVTAEPVARQAPAERWGTVREVEPITEQGKPSGAGAVIGGVLGAVAGNQIGDGKGRTAATVAGAAGGAYVGNRVERSRKKEVVGYRVRVEMPNGNMRTFEETQLDGLSVGDRVRVEGGRISRG